MFETKYLIFACVIFITGMAATVLYKQAEVEESKRFIEAGYDQIVDSTGLGVRVIWQKRLTPEK